MKTVLIILAIIFVSCSKETVEPFLKKEGSLGRPIDSTKISHTTPIPR